MNGAWGSMFCAPGGAQGTQSVQWKLAPLVPGKCLNSVLCSLSPSPGLLEHVSHIRCWHWPEADEHSVIPTPPIPVPMHP